MTRQAIIDLLYNVLYASKLRIQLSGLFPMLSIVFFYEIELPLRMPSCIVNRKSSFVPRKSNLLQITLDPLQCFFRIRVGGQHFLDGLDRMDDRAMVAAAKVASDRF